MGLSKTTLSIVNRRGHFFLTLKLLFSVALMWGLIEWGVVDPAAAIEMFSHPFTTLFACLLVLAGFVLGAIRWRLLLRVLQVDLPTRVLFKVVALSLLAGMIRTISGETVRVRYVVLGKPGQRNPLMASIVFDRVIGLFVLSIAGAVVVVPVLGRVLRSPELSVLAAGMNELPLVIVAMVGVCWSVGGILAKRLSAYHGESFRWMISSLARFFEAIYAYRGQEVVSSDAAKFRY